MEVNKFVTIKLRPVNGEYYRWTCPKCTGNYSYSESINNRWEIPHDKVYCGCCNILYNFDK